MNEDVEKKNRTLVKILVLVAVGMFGFGYALVPFYDTLCCWTGIRECKTELVPKKDNYVSDKNREINVEFITSVNRGTPIAFRAETKQLTAHPGEYYTVNFFAENKSNQAIVAHATPSFSPSFVANYFKKIECFCFSDQPFKAHEVKKLPMRFVIDPELPLQYKTITLSYTFFDTTEKQ